MRIAIVGYGTAGQTLAALLTGTQKGWFGKLSLPEEFLDALGAAFGGKPAFDAGAWDLA